MIERLCVTIRGSVFGTETGHLEINKLSPAISTTTPSTPKNMSGFTSTEKRTKSFHCCCFNLIMCQQSRLLQINIYIKSTVQNKAFIKIYGQKNLDNSHEY